MPAHFHRHIFPLMTKAKTPKILYLYEVDAWDGTWGVTDVVSGLRHFIESPTD